MVENNQQFIFNSEELSLLKNTFAENDPLLYTVRKVFLQFELTKDELVHLQSAINEAVITALKKRMLPDLSAEYPLGQIPSLLTTLTDQLKAKDADEMALQFEAKLLEQSYLSQQFEALSTLVAGKELPKPEITLAKLGEIKDKSKDQVYVEMTAYLFLLGYIDPMLIMVRSIAGEKAETLDQQKKRMTRNSSK